MANQEIDGIIFKNRDGSNYELDTREFLTQIPVGTDKVTGTLKLSDAVNSTSSVSSGVAATPKAVKVAYDLANDPNNAKKNKSNTFTEKQVFNKTIESHIASGTYIDAAKGNTIITTNAADDKFVPYFDYNSSTGSYFLYGYNNSINVGYITDANVTANQNKLNQNVVLLNKDGYSTFNNANISGALNANGVCNIKGKLTASGGGSFTGTWTAPTPSDNDNSTKIATTAFVKKFISNQTQLVKKSERTSVGLWTLSNLVINKPLFIVLDIPKKDWGSVSFHINDITSTIGGTWPQSNINEGAFHLGDMNSPNSILWGNSTNIFITFPQKTVIIVYLPGAFTKNFKLSAFQ